QILTIKRSVSIGSKDPNSLSRKHSNSVLVAYDLCEDEASTRIDNDHLIINNPIDNNEETSSYKIPKRL
ncbi:7341_t:CDS:2, partial [Entrophospora sp. SA101]